MTTVTDGLTHCPYRQASLIQQALAPNKMNVAFFVGAGCPMSIRITKGGKNLPLIPDIAGLTEQVIKSLQKSKELNQQFEKILVRLGNGGCEKPNVEEILTHIRSLAEVISGGPIDELEAKDLDALDKQICKVVTEVVGVALPSDDGPYHRLAAWIGGMARNSAVEVFTSNYDLLMEQAFEDKKVPYFDGFVGSRNTFFDLTALEQDNLPARWSRLWKVHGSINWCRSSAGDVERRATSGAADRQMIYPSHLKYDQSRRLPYLAMLDRLKAFLANGQAVLITCGYSFADQHINDAILQGLDGNPTAVCFGLVFGDRALAPEGVKKARQQPNLSLIAADGAVLGSIERDWSTAEDPDHALHGLAVKTGEMKDRTAAPPERCKNLLGDFGSLSDLLAAQLSQRESIDS